ncbi:hypothetical protein DIPPA_10323 [Diplonema papillatum]|nr:hypothetical protein DIPPA_10323 [Diplonema papillatum]KAJ9465319.1 hypothetical protein DIPPA_10323 [Diplonema papillatum]
MSDRDGPPGSPLSPARSDRDRPPRDSRDRRRERDLTPDRGGDRRGPPRDSRDRDRRPRRRSRDRSSSVDSVKVQRMCDERQEARRHRDYAMADRIQDDLRRIGVITNDERCSWTSRCGKRGGYANIGNPRRGGSVDSEEITDLCQKRQNAKNDKDYRRADDFRNALRRQGVQLSDADCSWSANDGRQHGVWSRWGTHRGKPVKRGYGRNAMSSDSDSESDRDRRRRRRRRTSSSFSDDSRRGGGRRR